MALDSPALAQFLAVYRHRSIGKACRELGLSQPALSKTIRRLEDKLNVRLFGRTSKGVEPTAYADTLARRAMVVGNELDRAEAEIEGIRTAIAGDVRIGVGPALAASLVSEALAAFLRNRPQMRVRLIEGLYEPLAEALLSGSLDFAITTRPTTPIASELSSEPLFTDRFLFAVSSKHALAGQGPRRLSMHQKRDDLEGRQIDPGAVSFASVSSRKARDVRPSGIVVVAKASSPQRETQLYV